MRRRSGAWRGGCGSSEQLRLASDLQGFQTLALGGIRRALYVAGDVEEELLDLLVAELLQHELHGHFLERGWGWG